jgi:hypothetical protein
LVAWASAAIFEHDGRRSTSRLDSISANVTLVHLSDVDVLGNVDIVREVKIGLWATLALGLGAERHGEVVVSVRGRARPRGVVHLSALIIGTAESFDLVGGIELLGVVSDEAEVVSTIDALTTLKVSGVLCRSSS